MTRLQGYRHEQRMLGVGGSDSCSSYHLYR